MSSLSNVMEQSLHSKIIPAFMTSFSIIKWSNIFLSLWEIQQLHLYLTKHLHQKCRMNIRSYFGAKQHNSHVISGKLFNFPGSEHFRYSWLVSLVSQRSFVTAENVKLLIWICYPEFSLLNNHKSFLIDKSMIEKPNQTTHLPLPWH